MTYSITMNCFCGMTVPLEEGLDRETAKAEILRRIRYKRAVGFEVTRLGKGRWEFVDGDAGMVGDDQGVIVLRRERRKAG